MLQKYEHAFARKTEFSAHSKHNTTYQKRNRWPLLPMRLVLSGDDTARIRAWIQRGAGLRDTARFYRHVGPGYHAGCLQYIAAFEIRRLLVCKVKIQTCFTGSHREPGTRTLQAGIIGDPAL